MKRLALIIAALGLTTPAFASDDATAGSQLTAMSDRELDEVTAAGHGDFGGASHAGLTSGGLTGGWGHGKHGGHGMQGMQGMQGPQGFINVSPIIVVNLVIAITQQIAIGNSGPVTQIAQTTAQGITNVTSQFVVH